MITTINKKLAQQIVKTVHDVCQLNINFINTEGLIFASNDEERIGAYHEIGHQCAKSGETIQVDTDDSYTGTKRGINIPIFYNSSVIAVIGISGDPEEAKKYAHLAERITHLLIREQDLNESHRAYDDKKLYVLECLMTGEITNTSYLEDCLKEFHISHADYYRAILITANLNYDLLNISLLEQHIQNLFHAMGQPLFTHLYPNRFVGIVSSSAFEWKHYMINQFVAEHHSVMKMAVGGSQPLHRLKESWESAQTAAQSIEQNDGDYVLFDNLNLEIILSSLPEAKRSAFRAKILSALGEEDKNILRTYYLSDMSLKRTSEQLFLHKNTVQQKLNRIRQKCNLNPRSFQDAVLLYLALRM